MIAAFQRSVSALAIACLVSTAQEQPIFRATTNLVDFTFVALDRKGNPVTDLKKEEISITDKGQQRNVVFFRFEGAGRDDESAPLKPLPPGTFSNRAEATPGPPRNLTAIILDTLNTPPTDQIWVRAQVMRYLRGIDRATRVALYALGNKVTILHDFTDDSDSLRARIDKVATALQSQPSTDIDQSARDSEQLLNSLPPDQRAAMQAMLTTQIETEMMFNEAVRERRLKFSLASLEALGNHLAGIPGRKSVVWIGGGISMLSISGAMGFGPRGGFKSYESLVKETSERLANQGIVLYIVDSRGLQGPRNNSAEIGAVSPAGRPRPFERQTQAADISSDPLPAMYKMAGITGGRVFTNTNDPSAGIKAVADDTRGAYSIGFYAGGEPDNKWHGVNLKVSRPGVKLIYRQGYLSTVAAEAPREWTDAQYRGVLSNPLGSTGVRVDAQCDQTTDSGAPALKMALDLAVADLHFRGDADRYAADVEVSFVQKRADGEAIDITRAGVTIRLTEARVHELQNGAVRYNRVWKLDPATSTVRLIVRDMRTGRYGTVDLPVKSIPAAIAARP